MSELIDHLLPSLKALAAKFEAQYSGLPIEREKGFLLSGAFFAPKVQKSLYIDFNND